MERNIKLIWDFYGPMAEGTAAHHQIHLDQYALSNGFEVYLTGHQNFDQNNSEAFLVVKERDMLKVRDDLKPHRAEVYHEKIS
ncbi:MAG: hypothetical protein C4K58_05570 [Flavobacteriaceae bacterium]|nr:MAG: hypothetical protein C4K58_05570 [Flavobacteriaceae bacterium]